MPLRLFTLACCLAIAAAIFAPKPLDAQALDASGSGPRSERAERGLALAQERCSGCHAVVPGATSANAAAPHFEDIANMPGLTSRSLRNYLRDSHNFPAAMKFTLKRRHVRDLADYVVTLRRADYRPEI